MKALTLWQPWASLLACGAKQYETRSWPTNYRGPIAIHAAALNPFKAIRELEDNTISAMMRELRAKGALPQHGDFRYLPTGCIIATAEPVGCHLMHEWESLAGKVRGAKIYINETEILLPSDCEEYLFGDWTPGRYAWEFANMTMLDEPIPTKGGKRIWNWDDSAIELL